jgi:hypothetical protein
VTMSAQHCNGRSADTPGTRCLPANESVYPVADNGPFTVGSRPPPTPHG